MAREFMITLAGDSLLLRLVYFHRRMIEHLLPSRIETTASLTSQTLFGQRYLRKIDVFERKVAYTAYELMNLLLF